MKATHQPDVNNIFHRLNNVSRDNVPGLALLIWTLVLILVGLDTIASTNFGLFLCYPFYSIMIWMIIGAFASGKVWNTIMFGLVGHVIILGFVIYIISTAEGGFYFAAELVAAMGLLAVVGLSAFLSCVVVLVSNRFANGIRNLWFLWVIVNVSSSGIGGLLGVYLGFTVFSDNIVIVSLVAGVVAGLIIGLAQWFLIRQVIKESGWWILATGIGLTIGSLLNTVTGSMTGQITGLLTSSLVSALAGSALGLTQWLVLRKQIDRARIWIAATMIAYVAGTFVVGIVNLGPLMEGTVQNILLGTVTGGVLVWLSRNYHLKSFQESV